MDFKNTVIIMTSNIGSRFLLDGVTRESIPEAVRESVMSELRRAFRPEFLSRIDETILFKPLTLEEITTIVDLLLADLNKRLADRRVTVQLDAKAKAWAAEKGYDPVFGARPLKRFLQRQIETKLARALIAGEIGEDTTATFHFMATSWCSKARQFMCKLRRRTPTAASAANLLSALLATSFLTLEKRVARF